MSRCVQRGVDVQKIRYNICKEVTSVLLIPEMQFGQLHCTDVMIRRHDSELHHFGHRIESGLFFK